VRAPYETLLGQFHDHPIIGPHLDGDFPDFVGMAAGDLWRRISSGELIMLNVALAIWNGDRAARIADLANLDIENRIRVVRALERTCAA
jgi:hypothetical protein